jgi:ankyrin repeat protein
MKTVRALSMVAWGALAILSLNTCASLVRAVFLRDARSNPNPQAIADLAKEGRGERDERDALNRALGLAAYSNPNPEVITALLEAGADVNAQDKDGMTALMFAAVHNPNPEVVSTLLEVGADAMAKNREGKTACDYAKDNMKLKGTDAYKALSDAQN